MNVHYNYKPDFLIVMKYLLNVISILLVVIWTIVFWSSNSFETIDLLLVMAGIILLIRILFNKQLSKKNEVIKTEKKPEASLN